MKRQAALVTGGAKRIGKEIVLQLAQKGYDIALHYNTSKGDAKLVSKEINKLGRKCVLFKCNLNKINQVQLLLKQVKKRFQNLSILINNASIFEGGKLIETNATLLDKHININFKAPFFLTKEFARVFKKGQIINLLDTNITLNKTRYVAYNLSKKLLNELTKISAMELAPNIRVNGIAPGKILPPRGKDEIDLRKTAGEVPLKRIGKIKNILQALDFLIENDYVTGECIFVDGGEHLKSGDRR